MRSNDWSNTAKVEQWLKARPTRNPVLEYLRDSFDTGDMHSSTLMALFGVADVLLVDAPELIPAEWQFSPSPLGADTTAYEYQTIRESMEAGATIQDVLKAGVILNRLDSLNRHTGISY